MVAFVILFALMALGILAAVVGAVRAGSSGPDSVPGSSRVRGTMQPLHAQELDDVIVLDGYVVLEEPDPVPALVEGPATLALCQPASTPFQARAAHLRLQEWIDHGTVLDVEIRHNGSSVELDVKDENSTMQFDVASAQ